MVASVKIFGPTFIADILTCPLASPGDINDEIILKLNWPKILEQWINLRLDLNTLIIYFMLSLAPLSQSSSLGHHPVTLDKFMPYLKCFDHTYLKQSVLILWTVEYLFSWQQP